MKVLASLDLETCSRLIRHMTEYQYSPPSARFTQGDAQNAFGELSRALRPAMKTFRAKGNDLMLVKTDQWTELFQVSND